MNLRVVIDTNVVLAAQSSPHESSPSREVRTRWAKGEFAWLISDDIVLEYSEKLAEKRIPGEIIESFLADLIQYGEKVPIQHFHFRHYPVDPDDTAFLLAALNGKATHTITYDQHLKDVGIFYVEFRTCEPVPFLEELRALHAE